MPSRIKVKSSGITGPSTNLTGFATLLRCPLFSTIILLLFSINLLSQSQFQEADKVYGPDPLVYNGKKYTYYLPPGVEGNQYFRTDEFSPGQAVVRGNTFILNQLNYDIYNQEVLLQYVNVTGAKNVIEISQAWLESFQLGEYRFELMALPGKERLIYQVLGTGDVRVLFYWTKDIKLDMAYGSEKYEFPPPERTRFLQIGKNYHVLKNNRTFIEAFDPGKQADIRIYMKGYRIKIKKASDNSLTELLTYCGSLLK